MRRGRRACWQNPLYTALIRRYIFPFMVPQTNFCNKCGARNAGSAQLCPECGEVQRVIVQAAPAGAPPAVRQIPVTSEVRYAGFWVRFVAALIDGILIQVAVLPISLLPGVTSSLSALFLFLPWPPFHHAHATGRYVLAFLLSWIYKAWMESSIEQATLGKKAMGLKVVGLDGSRISFARASGRYFAKLISVIFLIGYIMAGFSRRKQALHDMIADTLVLRIRS